MSPLQWLRIPMPMIASLLAALLAAPLPASATPGFSRQLQTDCSTCHSMGNRALNAYGRRFKQNALNEDAGMRRQRLQQIHRATGDKQSDATRAPSATE